jgi:hypothetical protein
MNPVDHTILEFCGNDFCAVTSLKSQVPSGTLYRHVTSLVRLGWLEKTGNLYRTTVGGHRQLQRPIGAQPWDALDLLYPPLAVVPTAVHRAMTELIFAAVVARQQAIRPDRHPFLAAVGGTMHWKTSLGRFVCHALGVDPTIHIVDCGSETGKSLSFRRNAVGDMVSRRNVLDAPFLVLDEFLTADPSMRSSLNLFLSGRLVMPIENEQLTIKPVPLLTLNPKSKDTLEGRVGLSAPLIRRGIFADLDAVPMPDLARVGEVAVQAARDHAPLVLGAPAADCQPFHDAIVTLTRAILTSEARDRVDVEILASLSTGMTALIPDPAGAIATVMHAVGVTAETLGWTNPGWVELVTDFTLAPSLKSARESEPRATADEMPSGNGKETSLVPSPAIRLVPERQVPARRGSVPALDLSDELRSRLIWLAVETRLSVDDAMTVLLDHYVQSLRNGDTIETLAAILRLAEALEMTSLDVETVHEYLTTRRALAEHNCTFDDVPEALALVRILEELPVSWDWEIARLAITAVGAILTARLTPDDVNVFLERHRRFEELDVDERTAEAIADALTRLAVPAEHRQSVMDHLIDNAARQVDVDALTNEAGQLRASIEELKAEIARLQAHRQEVCADIESLEGYRGTLRRQAARLEVQCTRMETDLAVARGLRNFLLRKKPDVAAFFTELARLQQWRRSGGTPEDAIGRPIVDDLHTKLLEFFQQLVAEQGSDRTQ